LKNLFLSLTVLFSITATAQITDFNSLEPKLKTKASLMGAVLTEAAWYEDHVIFSFDDAKYTQIKSKSYFTLTNEEVSTLYTEIKKRFEKESFEKEEGFMFETKDQTTLIITFTKSMGTKSLKINTSKNTIIALGYFLTQKQTKKLFNDNQD
jgi:hypothetical protein